MRYKVGIGVSIGQIALGLFFIFKSLSIGTHITLKNDSTLSILLGVFIILFGILSLLLSCYFMQKSENDDYQSLLLKDISDKLDKLTISDDNK